MVLTFDVVLNVCRRLFSSVQNNIYAITRSGKPICAWTVVSTRALEKVHVISHQVSPMFPEGCLPHSSSAGLTGSGPITTWSD